MKLLKCYVENFGKISKQEFQFKDNLTIFKEENGWGKTTLSVFIKAMLYGFEKNTKDKIERQKYKPWNNGKYGGNLDLEVNGIRYRIERFFGETPKGDKFTLINLETNKEVNTYTEKIGEEIFKLDKESFEKSIYIPQQAIEIEISNDLTTKLTNLDTIKDDMDKYEEAQKILNKKSDELKKKIKNIETEEKEIEAKIEKCEEAQKNFEKYQEENRKLQIEQEQKRKEIELLEEQSKKLNEQQLKEEIKKRYIKMQEEEKKATIEYEQTTEFFKNRIPEQEEISDIENKIIQIKKATEEKIELQKLYNTETENRYDELTLEEIEEKQRIYDSYKEIEKNIQEIEKDKKIKEYELNNSNKNKIYSIIAIAIVLLGIISLVFIEKKIISIVIIVIGIIFWIIQNKLIGKNKKIKNEVQKYEKQLIKNKEEKERTENELFEYIKKYGENYNEVTIYEELLKIKLNYEKYKKSQKIIEQTKPEIEKFLYNYFDSITDDYSRYLEQIKIKLINIKSIEARYKESVNNKQEFLKEYNIEDLEKTEYIVEPIENINEKIKKIKADTEIIVQNIAFYTKRMDEFSTIVDEKSELEIDLDNYNEEKKQLEKKKSVIDKTIEILYKTKEKLSTKYLNGMNENLNKYIKLLVENSNIINKTSIDIDLNTNIEIDGEKKDLKAFSTGYKDLIGICIRLALIDCIFKDEKPFLILDDPFVNLDEEKINNAMNLIREISNKHQIIYFACHDSRT